ncbi:MAG: YicC/YloC family endoribonuclease [Pseudomonadota bacterium]
MIRSMTAFAAEQGQSDGVSWSWEVRSVNGRGLDLRLRLPDGATGMEPKVRDAVGKIAARGNVTVNLKAARDADDAALSVDQTRLDLILDALDAVQERAFSKGVTLGQPTAADVLAQKGVLVATREAEVTWPDVAMLAGLDAALSDFAKMREGEGARLATLISGQIDDIARLTDEARALLPDREAAMADALKAGLAKVMDVTGEVDPDRVAQELAVIAVKSDITEELDRLDAHVSAARALMEDGGPVGRKLDFLTQEFNREANTLCSKSQAVALTQVGLALKAVIDQMREQVQNVE